MARLHDLKHVDLDNCYWGVSTSLWFNGCPHKCVGCWNAETWDVDETLERPNSEVIEEVLTALDEFGMAKDLTLLGGDPLSPFNIKDVVEIVSEIKKKRPKTRVLCWTGYRWEQLVNNKFLNQALPYIDILIDGKYEKDLHIDGHKFGSTNQRVIDVQKSLTSGSKVLAPENYIKGEDKE